MPQYSFGARFEQKNKNYTPGPSFNVQDQTRYGRPRVLAYTMAPRTFRQGNRHRVQALFYYYSRGFVFGVKQLKALVPAQRITI